MLREDLKHVLQAPADDITGVSGTGPAGTQVFKKVFYYWCLVLRVTKVWIKSWIWHSSARVSRNKQHSWSNKAAVTSCGFKCKTVQQEMWSGCKRGVMNILLIAVQHVRLYCVELSYQVQRHTWEFPAAWCSAPVWSLTAGCGVARRSSWRTRPETPSGSPECTSCLSEEWRPSEPRPEHRRDTRLFYILCLLTAEENEVQDVDVDPAPKEVNKVIVLRWGWRGACWWRCPGSPALHTGRGPAYQCPRSPPRPWRSSHPDYRWPEHVPHRPGWGTDCGHSAGHQNWQIETDPSMLQVNHINMCASLSEESVKQRDVWTTCINMSF